MGFSYQCPNPSMLAKFGQEGRDLVYLLINAWECATQFALARAADIDNMKGANIGQWKLLLSGDISENVVHTWGKYEAMSGKLQELMDTAVQTSTSAASILPNVGTGAKSSGNNKDVVESAINTVNAWLGTQSERVKNTKVDASMVYQDSNNREYTFELELLAYSDPKSEVWEPIQKLMYYSCADAKGSLNITFPAIFEIKTWSNNMASSVLHLKTAALVAVQPTWKFPWKDGYPMNASVMLTFREILPLYRKTLDGKSLVSVSRSEENTFGIKDSNASGGGE